MLKEAAVKGMMQQALERMVLPKEILKVTPVKRDPLVKKVPMQDLVLRKVWREPRLLLTVKYLQKRILQLLGRELEKTVGLEQRVLLTQTFQQGLRIKWKERPWL